MRAVIIAGAFETPTRRINSHEWFTNPFVYVENLAMANTSSRYQQLGRRVLDCGLAEGIVVPDMGTIAGLGAQPVYKSFEKIYADAEAAILAKIQSDGGQQAYLIGHSLGGNIATIAAHKYPHLVAGVVSIGTPHDGIDATTDLLYTHLNDALRNATAEVGRRRAMLDTAAPWLATIASNRDDTVSVASAMPAMADYHLPFSHHNNLHHVDMMHDKAIVEFCGQVVAGTRFSNLPHAA